MARIVQSSAVLFCVQVNSLELAHMQTLHDRVEEVEVKLMGDMAYMKTGHQQEIEELQSSYNREVCHDHSVCHRLPLP